MTGREEKLLFTEESLPDMKWQKSENTTSAYAPVQPAEVCAKLNEFLCLITDPSSPISQLFILIICSVNYTEI